MSNNHSSKNSSKHIDSERPHSITIDELDAALLKPMSKEALAVECTTHFTHSKTIVEIRKNMIESTVKARSEENKAIQLSARNSLSAGLSGKLPSSSSEKQASTIHLLSAPVNIKYDFNVAKSMKSGTRKSEEEEAHKELQLGSFDVWALGITVVIGGQYFQWNVSLAAGFGSCYIAMLMIGIAYLCLCLCNAELTSSMPFAGGAYGLARVSLGLWPGFMVGCCEALEYILYTSSSALSLAGMIQSATGTLPFTISVYALVFYIFSLVVTIHGGRIFWHTTMFLGVISLLLLLMYNFGSLRFINSAINLSSPGTTGADPDSTPAMFIGGFTAFLTQLPLAGWWYVGVESLNMTASIVKEPRRNIPVGSLTCIGTLIATAIFTAAVCPSLPMPLDGTTTATSMAPLNVGYGLMFNVDPATTLAISIPATFATAFGFIFASGRVIICMARSGLFPEFMAVTYGKFKTPIVAYLVGQGLGFLLCVLGYYYPVIGSNLYNICILSGFIAYVSQLTGYLIFKYKFPRQDRKFTSPLGAAGACYGILVFTLAGISVIGFQPDNHIAIVTMLILLIIYSTIYHLYAKKTQFFSVDEKFIFQVYMNSINSGDNKAVSISNQAGNASIGAAIGASYHVDDNDNDDNSNDDVENPSTQPMPETFSIVNHATQVNSMTDVNLPAIHRHILPSLDHPQGLCEDHYRNENIDTATPTANHSRHASSIFIQGVQGVDEVDSTPSSPERGRSRANSTDCLVPFHAPKSNLLPLP